MGKVIKRRGLLVSLIIIIGTLLMVGLMLFNDQEELAVASETSKLLNEAKKQPSEKNLQMEKELKAEKELIQKHQIESKKRSMQKAVTKPEQVPPPKKETPQPAEPAKKTIYLTFDDGPQKISPEILALLDQYQFKVTFFMLDGNIKRYPDAVNQMVGKGHAIGIHGVSHKKEKFYASKDSVIGELTQTRNTLKSITGIDTYLVRTPFGSDPYMTAEYLQAVKANGYFMWDWNIDSRDWFYKDARFVNSVIAQIEQKSASNQPLVILLHERIETLANLPALLDYLSKHNYESKALDITMVPIQF